MKKAKLKYAELRIDPFKRWLTIGIGDDVHLTANELAKLDRLDAGFPPSAGGRACFATVPEDDGFLRLYMAFNPELRAEEIAHECFHAVVFLSSADHRGDAITEASTDCWAYAFEKLFSDVMREYQNLGGKITLPPKK
jgi:hypothetical protein